MKVFAGQAVTGGEIIVRQRGTRFHPGEGVGIGRDDTIFATRPGTVQFASRPPRPRDLRRARRRSSLRALTYSIVARDPSSGELGVAVQSHFFGVGSIVSWAEAGVGAVATQSVVEPAYGPRGLALMNDGKSAPAALHQLLADDPQEAARQVAMIDRGGRVAVHTGSRCIKHAGHAVGDQVSAQANIMERDTVPAAMVRAYSGGFRRGLRRAAARSARRGPGRGRRPARPPVRGALDRRRRARPGIPWRTGPWTSVWRTIPTRCASCAGC